MAKIIRVESCDECPSHPCLARRQRLDSISVTIPKNCPLEEDPYDMALKKRILTIVDTALAHPQPMIGGKPGESLSILTKALVQIKLVLKIESINGEESNTKRLREER